MNNNVGKADKAFRYAGALVFAIIGYFTGLWWAYVVSAILLITAAMGFCGVYKIYPICTQHLTKDTTIYFLFTLTL